MHYLQFEATPLRNHPEASTLGGAYVNCWVVAETQSDAETMARKSIIEQLWRIDKLTECYEDDRSLYDADADGLQYYDQAEIDGGVYVFHTYLIDDDSE